MNAKAPRVLVVDAQEAVQAQARLALQAAGMEVTEAADAAAALALFSPESFDVVLLDLDLPGQEPRRAGLLGPL